MIKHILNVISTVLCQSMNPRSVHVSESFGASSVFISMYFTEQVKVLVNAAWYIGDRAYLDRIIIGVVQCMLDLKPDGGGR